MEKKPRELVAFAFVQEEYQRTGDLLAGVMPLFAPILVDRISRVFDPQEFASEVQARYGIPMPQIAAEGIADRLLASKYLFRDDSDTSVVRVSRRNEAHQTDHPVESVVEGFVYFARQGLDDAHLTASDEEIERAFLERITSLDFLALIERPEKNYFRGTTLTLKKQEESADESEPLDLEVALDVLSAEYALDIAEKDPDSFELLGRLVGGAIIAEVVLTLQSPSQEESLAGITIILDGPLVLDYLDLSTPELRDYAFDLFTMLRDARMNLAVFAHTVEEMKGTISGPLDAVAHGRPPFGPLGRRISHDPAHQTYARTLLDDLEGKLLETSIDVLDADQFRSEKYLELCTQEIEEALRNALGDLHFRLEPRERDAASLASVVRLRGSGRTRNFAEATVLFITRNSHLAKRGNDLLVRKGLLRKEDFPPALSDRQIAGLLWFAVGGNVGEMSLKKLVANCATVLDPRGDVVSKIRQYLLDLDPNKEAQFTAMMRDKRARTRLSHITLGQARTVTVDNAEEILADMKRSLAVESERKAQEQIAVITDEFQAQLDEGKNSMLEVQTELLELRQERVAFEKHRDTMEQTLSGLSAEVHDKENQVSTERERLRQSCIEIGREKARNAKVLIVIAYGLVALLATLLLNDVVAKLLSVLLGLFGFWIVPRYLFEPLVTDYAKNAVFRHAWKSDMAIELSREEVRYIVHGEPT